MKTTCHNTLNLLDNLLTWSRSQIGRLDCNPIVFHIRNIVNETIFLLSKNAMNKNVRLSSLIRDDTMVFADMNMITTVVRNLMSNAIKYTPEGGSISIEDSDKGNALEISVSDTGVGMNSEDMEKIFRIDMRYSTPGTAKEQGTGLGLNLCKEFVEKNGGMIGVESEPGKGSRFYFTLPKPTCDMSADYDTFSASASLPPLREELEKLIDFARLGDIGAIRQEADTLMRTDKQLIPFAKELKQLAGTFQISKIRMFLKSFESSAV
jgi:K+-sensing histidine kinase KdpD